MSKPIFVGSYEAKLKNNTVRLVKYFSYVLKKYRISEMYLSKGEDKIGKILRKKFKYLNVFTDPPIGNEYIPVRIKKDEIKIPDELVEYANLKFREVVIMGIETPPSHLEIWNKDRIDKIAKSKTSDKEMEEVADFFIEQERKKLQVH